MIDTIKMFTMINPYIYNNIMAKGNVKTSYNNETKEIFYTIINGNIEGSYNSNFSIRVGNGEKYKFVNMYFIEIEGSYHKIVRGYNSHNGFYNIQNIAYDFIKLTEQAYNVTLPTLKHWFLQRVDIALCYDLGSQNNVETYIDNLNSCNYPKRKLKHYEGESIYLTGTTTTLKIYNKLKEFEKHDLKKFQNTDFNLPEYLNEINGFVRFECEIKKKKLQSFYGENFIRISNVNYADLKKIWTQEFSKLLKLLNGDLKIIQDRASISNRLQNCFSKVRANNLYNFYILIETEGLQTVKKRTCKSVFYKNISDLRKVQIDFSQKFNVNMNDNRINFNPFESNEII